MKTTFWLTRNLFLTSSMCHVRKIRGHLHLEMNKHMTWNHDENLNPQTKVVSRSIHRKTNE